MTREKKQWYKEDAIQDDVEWDASSRLIPFVTYLALNAPPLLSRHKVNVGIAEDMNLRIRIM
jgi:hypothetical protein